MIVWLIPALIDGLAPACPACGEPALTVAYAGDPETRLGFGVVWCQACRCAVRLSRLRVPKGILVLSEAGLEQALAPAEPLRWVV